VIPIKPSDAIWTDEQWNAIYDKGHNIIVSAGAGSGKTAVLSERVIENLKSGMSIKEVLLLTFTKAASLEMKTRIRNKIKKNPSLSKELSLIDEAYITTFDSFALSIVKKYHYILNISPNVSIIDDAIIRIKKKEILTNIFDKYYENRNEKFLKLISDFCIKDDKEIFESILSIYSKIDLKYNKNEYLDNYINEYFNIDRINNDIKDYEKLLMSKFEELDYLIEDMSYYTDSDYITNLRLSVSNLMSSKTYDEIVSNLSVEIPRLPKGSTDEVKEKKELINDVIKNIKSLCIYKNREEIMSSILSTKDYKEVIIDILKDFDEYVMSYKYENDIYEFTDIANLAIKLVKENVSVREELKSSFKEIMIDEYQDTNDLQEILINMISNNNVYMVGDIKQSIYRFRNANPDIFKEKYNKYSNHIGGEKIDLNKNFRSREEVLNNINLLFNKVMDESIGGADYIKSHQMIFGNKSYINKGKTIQNYDFELYSYIYDKKSEYSKEEIEAFIIAKDIFSKVKGNYQIFDKDTSVLRNAEYSDFVILMDRTTNFDLYKKIFLYLGIPLELYKDETMNEDTDIIVLNNLIKFTIKLDTGVYDKELEYLFTSIMRSFLCESSDEEIFDTIKNKTILGSNLANKVRKIKLNNKSSYEIINDLINEFDFYNKIITIGNESASSVKLNSILSNAKTTSNIGYDINSFSEYLDNVIKEKIDIKYTIHSGVSNSVKIMTIHKSKGLEFPICYFSGLYKPFNISDIKEKFTYSNKYGIITPYFDEGVGETIYKHLLKNDYLKEEISEKIRLFYVALTRAKEKMILVMPYEEIVNGKESDLVSSVVRSKYKSLLDIVSSTLVSLTKYVTVIDYNKTGITKDYSLLIKKDFKSGIEKSSEVLNVNEILVENESVIDKHYSKENNKLITTDTKRNIEFGKYVHEVLEYFDLKTKNFSYIKDEFIKNKVMSFAKLKIFDNVKDANIFHEYEFVYTLDNTKYHGVIDLMLEYTDHIDIIDYKLSDITDVNYISQLNGYKDYISSITKKPVNVYLYSIINEKISSL
jgi:ATP-dependent helicase/nuclease subunit A